MKFKNNKLFEAYIRSIAREIITEKVHAKDRAREKTLEVIKNFFNDGSWLYGEYENEAANPEHLNVLEYIEYSLIHTFFHSNNPDAVIRLEPLVCKLALRLGFEQLHPIRPKLNRLKKIVRYIKNNFRKEGFPIALSEINIDTTTFNDLNSIFGKYIDDEMSSDNQNANNFKDETNRNHRYKVLSNIDYNTAHSYEKYTCSKSPMCFTEDKGTWDQYTNGDDYAVYLLLRDDWKTVEEVHGENTPYDDYGYSMIFVIIDEEGNISSSNTRWNHELGDGHMTGDVDSAFTKTQLSELLGVNFNSVFKPKQINDASSFEDECRRYAETLSNDPYQIEIITQRLIATGANRTDESKNRRNMKQTIKLTESKLRNMIKEAVQNALNEVSFTDANGVKHDNLHGTDSKAWLQMAKLRKQQASQYPKYSPEWEKNRDAKSRNVDNAADIGQSDLNNLQQSLKNY